MNHIWRMTQKNRKLIIDLALPVAATSMLFTEATMMIFLFHLIFFLLTFGAFYWKLQAFVLRAVLWVTVTTFIILNSILAGRTHSEEFIELPLMTAILVLVFVIAQQRTKAQKALRRTNESLESRVKERTAELTKVNAQLTQEVAEHKETEQALRESEERYRRSVELSFEAVAIHAAGKILSLNGPGAKLLGAETPDELIGQSIFDFVHPDYLDMVQRRVQLISEVGEGAPLAEEKFVRLDGASLDVEVAGVPITYRGQPAAQIVLRDITARKQAEAERERLLTTEREQRLLAETLGEIFLALTSQTSYESVLDEILRQARRLVSYSAANIVLLRGDTLHKVHSQGYEAFKNSEAVIDLKQSLADLPLDAQVVRSRQPLVIPDTRQNLNWVAIPELTWIRSFIAVPICLRDTVLGLLRLDGDRPGKFSTQDIERLLPLANAAAIALENARLHDQARQKISERIQAEKALRRVAAKNQAILDAIPDSIFHLDRAGNILDYKIYDNDTPDAILGTTGIAKALTEMLSSEVVEQMLDSINKTVDSGASQVFEYQISVPQGDRDFEARFVASGSDEVLAIIRDITERKARAAALEQERTRIARELHDSLGQSLGYLHLKLDEFTRNGNVPDFEEQLAQMRDVANEAYELVRSMLAAARPSNSTDLATALLAQAKAAGNRARFDVSMTNEGRSRPLPPVAQHQVLYLFQEALNNVVKHAKARRVDLNLIWSADALAIALTDDGCGFDTGAPRPDGHFGLTIMQERAEEINGFLSISSNPEAGTVLTLRLPLAHPQKSRVL